MEQNTQNAALLVIDVQVGIMGMLPGAEGLVNNVKEAIAAARSKKIPVIFVVVGFRKGAPEVSPNNKSFGAGKGHFAATDMGEFMKVHADIAPQDGELIVTKRRVSAFTGSDLEVVLRSQGIHHIVLTGVATSGAILSTTREAADRDYKVTIIDDCCADSDEEVHRVLTTKVFPRQADVVKLADWSK